MIGLIVVPAALLLAGGNKAASPTNLTLLAPTPAQFLRPGSDTDAVGLSDREEQPDDVRDPNAVSDPVALG